jgi:hypothetical protein
MVTVAAASSYEECRASNANYTATLSREEGANAASARNIVAGVTPAPAVASFPGSGRYRTGQPGREDAIDAGRRQHNVRIGGSDPQHHPTLPPWSARCESGGDQLPATRLIRVCPLGFGPRAHRDSARACRPWSSARHDDPAAPGRSGCPSRTPGGALRSCGEASGRSRAS